MLPQYNNDQTSISNEFDFNFTQSTDAAQDKEYFNFVTKVAEKAAVAKITAVEIIPRKYEQSLSDIFDLKACVSTSNIIEQQ